MTRSRTYRKALPLEVALSEIRRCSGTQFDPALAEVFLRTTPDGFRDLLSDHHAKAKKFRELQETLRSQDVSAMRLTGSVRRSAAGAGNHS